MFRTFRRKPSRRSDDDEPVLVARPSLPQLSSPGIPWPEDLVDMAAIRATPPPAPPTPRAAKTSLASPETIPWHKPFRPRSSTSDSEGAPNGTISALYMSPGPLDPFDPHARSLPSPALTARPGRRARVPPQFNIMVAGAAGTGKTSLLRLLLDTADVSPGATAEQRGALERFLRGAPRPTREMATVTVEVAESRFERVLLSVTDTPGLDLRPGRELTLNRQVSGIIKHIDSTYAETMNEESKVVRQSKADRHVHLLIYMLDPGALMTAAQRRDTSALPHKSRSDTTVSAARHADEDSATPPLTDDNSSEDDARAADSRQLMFTPAEIHTLRRLASRTNVLPVIGHADALTDARLAAVKAAVRRELARADLDFGVFSAARAAKVAAAAAAAAPSIRSRKSEDRDGGRRDERGRTPSKPRPSHKKAARSVDDSALAMSDSDEEAEGDDADDTRRARPVIKLRPGRRHSSARARSRSRSRMDLASEARDDHEPTVPDAADADSVSVVRFSAAAVAREDYGALLPFALVAPEHTRRHRSAQPAPWDEPGVAPSEDGHSSAHTHASGTAELSPREARPPVPPRGVPEDLRGVFTRKFRWGNIDVLEPAHCDFAVLRTAILSTHMKVLKAYTREVLYERFRTEKLLVRRATKNIGEEEAKRLLADLGI